MPPPRRRVVASVADGACRQGFHGPAGRRVSFGSLLRGSLLYTIGSVVPRIGIFLLLPIYTLGMGPADFGIFSLMLSLAGLLTILYRLGLDGALLRFHFEVEGPRTAALYWTMAVITLAAGLLLSLLIGTVAAPVFSTVFTGVALMPYGWLAIGIALLTAFQYVPTTWFRAVERPVRVVVFGFLTFGAGAVVTLWLVLGLHLGAVGGLLGQLASGVVVVAVTLALLLRRRPAGLDRDIAEEGLRFGLPLIPHSIAGWVLNLSDRWVIGLTIGLAAAAAQRQIGIYSLGYQLGQVVAVVAISLNTAWVPFFYVRGEHERGPDLLREMTTLSVAALAILTIMVGVLAPEVVAVLAPKSWGGEASVAALVTPLVAMACLIQGFYFMAVSPIFLQRRTAILPLFTLAAGALNVGLNILIIPVLGVVGAGWSTIAGYGLLAAGTVWYARRGYVVRFDWLRFAGQLLVVAAAIVIAQTIPITGLVARGTAHLAIGLLAAGLIVLMSVRPWNRARSLVAVTARSAAPTTAPTPASAG
jgi:O-antigen/teichoic acid export membrane protein